MGTDELPGLVQPPDMKERRRATGTETIEGGYGEGSLGRCIMRGGGGNLEIG